MDIICLRNDGAVFMGKAVDVCRTLEELLFFFFY